MSAHRAMYPIRTMARVPEGFGLGLLRLAEPTSFGSGDRRRRSDASIYPHDPTLDRMEPMARRVFTPS